MKDLLTSNSLFAIMLTLLVWRMVSALQKKLKTPILNPILISVAAIVLVLLISKVPNKVYQQNMNLLNWLITPATVSLAIPLFEQFKLLRQHFSAVLIGVLCGTISSIVSVFFLCKVFGLDQALTASLLPKSVTTAIGAPLSENMGGLKAISVSAIITSGILGNISAPLIVKLFSINDSIAQGVAIGTSAHVIGTVKANEFGSIQGAVSSLSLIIAGILTTVILSVADMIS